MLVALLFRAYLAASSGDACAAQVAATADFAAIGVCNVDDDTEEGECMDVPAFVLQRLFFTCEPRRGVTCDDEGCRERDDS